jgi:hypothetical protein
MFAASLFFLGLAVCLFASLTCFTLAKFVKWDRTSQSSPEYAAVWNQIKTAVKMYSQNQPEESTTQKTLRSWTGTLVICAGLCMIGILLEVNYDRPISADSVIAGFVPIARVPGAKQHPGQHAKSQPAKKSTVATPATPAPTK